MPGESNPPAEQKARGIPHDQLFKTLCATFFLELVELFDLELSQDEQIRYDRQLEDSNDAEEVKIMQMTWADKMVAKGREEGLSMGIARGREEGIARGQLQGARQVLAGQIEYRFGSLSDACRRQLERIEDPQEIDQLARRLVEAQSLRDLGLDDVS